MILDEVCNTRKRFDELMQGNMIITEKLSTFYIQCMCTHNVFVKCKIVDETFHLIN